METRRLNSIPTDSTIAVSKGLSAHQDKIQPPKEVMCQLSNLLPIGGKNRIKLPRHVKKTVINQQIRKFIWWIYEQEHF